MSGKPQIVALHSVEFDGNYLVVRFLMTDGTTAATHWPKARLEGTLATIPQPQQAKRPTFQ